MPTEKLSEIQDFCGSLAGTIRLVPHHTQG